MSIDVEPASLIKRAAVVFDHFLATIIGSILAVPVFFLLADSLTNLHITLFAVYLAVFHIAYFTFFEGRIGTTPVKRVIDLHVVRNDGTPISYGRALLRNVMRIIDMSPAIYLVGAGFIIAHRSNQRLGDKLAGVVVIDTDKTEQEDTEETGNQYRIKENERDTKMQVVGYSLAGLGILPLFGLILKLVSELLELGVF